jgi:hypothetical protein
MATEESYDDYDMQPLVDEQSSHVDEQVAQEFSMGIRGKGLVGKLELVPMWLKLSVLSLTYMIGLLLLGALVIYNYSARLSEEKEADSFAKDFNLISNLVTMLNMERYDTAELILKGFSNVTLQERVAIDIVNTDYAFAAATKRFRLSRDAAIFSINETRMDLTDVEQTIQNYTEIIEDMIYAIGDYARKYYTNAEYTRAIYLSTMTMKENGMKFHVSSHSYASDPSLADSDRSLRRLYRDRIKRYANEFINTKDIILTFGADKMYTVLRSYPIVDDSIREAVRILDEHDIVNGSALVDFENQISTFRNNLELLSQDAINLIDAKREEEVRLAVILLIICVVLITFFFLLSLVMSIFISITITGPWKRLNTELGTFHSTI